MKIDLITLFPQVIQPFFELLPYKRALEKDIVDIKLWNLRNFCIDKHGTVDDKPYGGGKGMILLIEPIHKSLERIEKHNQNKYLHKKTILLSPRGKTFTQEIAKDLSNADQITLISGRYEGVDHRVEENLVTDVVSIGDYVLSGGETPALAVMESVVRLLPGVLSKDAIDKESFENGKIEHPQYTRPKKYKGWAVPPILLSGNHKEIENWKKENSTKN